MSPCTVKTLHSHVACALRYWLCPSHACLVCNIAPLSHKLLMSMCKGSSKDFARKGTYCEVWQQQPGSATNQMRRKQVESIRACSPTELSKEKPMCSWSLFQSCGLHAPVLASGPSQPLRLPGAFAPVKRQEDSPHGISPVCSRPLTSDACSQRAGACSSCLCLLKPSASWRSWCHSYK
jgi:hypothetical protein